MNFREIPKKLFGRNKSKDKIESARISEDNAINVGRQSRFFGLLSPDEVGRVIPKSLTLREIKNMTASQLLRTLISMSSDMDSAVVSWQSHVASVYRLDPTGDREQEIIENFIARTELGGEPFQAKLEGAAYNRYVEGGLLAELYADDETGEFVDIALPSPFSLRYNEVIDPTHGRYFQVGQGELPNNYRVLQDRANPNPLVEWAPTKKFPDKPFGRSMIASNIFGTVSIMELVNLIMEYVRGQAMPKGVVQIPRETLAKSGYTPSQITEIVNTASSRVEKALSESDWSQALTVATEVAYTVMGAMGRSDLDASEMIIEILEQSQRRGYKLPSAIYGGTGERRGSFGEYGERVEWQAFDRIVKPERDVISTAFTNLFRQVLRSEGSMGECGLLFDETDLELERIEAEKLNIEYEGYSVLIKDKVITPLEVRRVVKKTDKRFADLADEPEGDFLETNPQPTGDQNPEPQGDV